ncbi:MAG: DUF4337 domain-containing protein [Bryobacteraceae bacterium]
MADTETKPESTESTGLSEATIGITLALFAAILAVTDLGGGKYGDDEIKAVNEKANAYQWYSTKGIKETQVEGEAAMLDALVQAGVISGPQVEGVKSAAEKARKRAKQYGREKNEILLGSATVGKDNWAQDVGGVMGKVVGAREWEKKVDELAKAGDFFDLATVFLQLGLVMGAVALVLKDPRTRSWFYYGLIAMGLVGAGLSVRAWMIGLGT